LDLDAVWGGGSGEFKDKADGVEISPREGAIFGVDVRLPL